MSKTFVVLSVLLVISVSGLRVHEQALPPNNYNSSVPNTNQNQYQYRALIYGRDSESVRRVNHI